jgi:hypothetical protein
MTDKIDSRNDRRILAPIRHGGATPAPATRAAAVEKEKPTDERATRDGQRPASTEGGRSSTSASEGC